MNYPILQVTGNIIIRPVNSLQVLVIYVNGLKANYHVPLGIQGKMKADIPAKYWMQVPAADQPGYQKMMRESRIDLTKRGVMTSA